MVLKNIFSDSPLQPKEEKKKSLKKIEAKPKPTSSLNGAITPIKPITTRLGIYFFEFCIYLSFSFVKMTIIPPVYSQSQLETLKSLDQLNQPGLVLLPSPQPQLLNGTSTKPKTERSYVKIEKNTKPKVSFRNKNYGFSKIYFRMKPLNESLSHQRSESGTTERKELFLRP